MKTYLITAMLLLSLVPVASATDPAPFAPDDPRQGTATTPSRHQDSVRMGLLTSAVQPADGLLAIQAGFRSFTTVYEIADRLVTLDHFDWHLGAEATPLPWLTMEASLPLRSWSGGTGWIPPSGSGLGDGFWQATVGSPASFGGLHAALFGGGNIPVGNDDLGEGVFSPHAGAALSWRFFQGRQVPEMRLHLNLGYRWNKDEENGYGVGNEGFQPWDPRYPTAAEAGGDAENDLLRWRAALEFRKNTTSLWVYYARDRFGSAAGIDRKEQFKGLGAGMRWGLMEGWALHGSYLISLIEDDPASTWEPAYPEWVMQVGLSRQFGIGGRDRDGDGIVDRHDHCPLFAEDLDGFADEDGCPDEDNDGDGIPDALDGAPLQAEDFDGFEDHDGVPDLDNDGDGILDRYDLCPNEPEDMDGHRDDDGCPDDFQDRDNDGVEDSLDVCPDRAEDKDGFEDGDGCPDEDNDLDGIPDSQDACPDEPEDYDGVDDEDGCPE